MTGDSEWSLVFSLASMTFTATQSGRLQLQAEGASLSAVGCGLSEVMWSGTEPTTV